MEILQLNYRNNATVVRNKFKPILSSEASKTWQYLVWIFLGAGIGLRLFHYLDNRSLWTDEIYLSISLIKMNFLELTIPMLTYEQKAPIGFLWLVRLCVVLFGKSEMALRLIPLLSGIAALFLFVPVCRYFLKPLGVVVAVGLLALAPPLVYHAVEIKQYGFDLFVTVVALNLYIQYHKKTDLASLCLWGIFGAILLWFSFAAIFVMAGMAIGVFLSYLFKKNWAALFKCLIPFSCWLASFAVNYFLFTYQHTDSEWLISFFKFYGGFMPFPPRSYAELNWFVQTPYKMLFYPLGFLWNASEIHNVVLRTLLKIPVVAMLFLVVGLFSFARGHKQWFMILLFPLLLHLVASWLELYPFMERFIVFAAPLLMIFIARGCDSVVGMLPAGTKWLYLLPVLVLAGPLAGSAMQLINPEYFGGYKKSTQREGLLYVNNHFRQGDAVYVYWNAKHAYQFYQDAYNLKYKAVEGHDVRFSSKSTSDYFKNLAPDFAALAGKERVWIIYNKKLDIDIGDEITALPLWYSTEVKGGEKLRAFIRTMGKEKQTFETLDVNVSLFDLSGKK